MVAEARLMPCHLRRPDEIRLGWVEGTPEPSDEAPGYRAERGRGAEERHRCVPCNIPPGNGATRATSDEDTRSRLAGRRGVEERQRSRDNIPEGKDLGDGRRPAVGLPAGRPLVLLYDTKRC